MNASGTLTSVPDYFEYTASLLRGTGAVMGVTVVPVGSLADVSEGALTALGLKCLSINQALGVQILLTFAPQHNGNWLPYGQDPVIFRAKFRFLAGIVKGPGSRNATALVWAPHSGYGYPYALPDAFASGPMGAAVNGSRPTTAAPPSPATNPLLDTNGNGRLDAQDDPYAPYYPGDDVVDWCALSLYAMGADTYFPLPPSAASAHPANALPAAGSKLGALLTSPGALSDFHDTYALAKGKPMLVSATAAAWYTMPGVGGAGEGGSMGLAKRAPPVGPDELTLKQAWWELVLDRAELRVGHGGRV